VGDHRSHYLEGNRLVFYTHSIGADVERFFGQDDIESWTTVTIPDLGLFARRLAEHLGTETSGAPSRAIPRLVSRALKDRVFLTGYQVADWAEETLGCSVESIVR
jgi:hypothetical protein